MKAYKFIFLVGAIQIALPYIGIPQSFKDYGLMSVGIVAVLYAVFLRAIIKEKENQQHTQIEQQETDNKTSTESQTLSHPVSQTTDSSRTIDDVIDMYSSNTVHTVQKKKKVAIKPPRTSRTRIMVSEDTYE